MPAFRLLIGPKYVFFRPAGTTHRIPINFTFYKIPSVLNKIMLKKNSGLCIILGAAEIRHNSGWRSGDVVFRHSVILSLVLSVNTEQDNSS